jgi:hypothetical protein
VFQGFDFVIATLRVTDEPVLWNSRDDTTAPSAMFPERRVKSDDGPA